MSAKREKWQRRGTWSTLVMAMCLLVNLARCDCKDSLQIKKPVEPLIWHVRHFDASYSDEMVEDASSDKIIYTMGQTRKFEISSPFELDNTQDCNLRNKLKWTQPDGTVLDALVEFPHIKLEGKPKNGKVTIVFEYQNLQALRPTHEAVEQIFTLRKTSKTNRQASVNFTVRFQRACNEYGTTYEGEIVKVQNQKYILSEDALKITVPDRTLMHAETVQYCNYTPSTVELEARYKDPTGDSYYRFGQNSWDSWLTIDQTSRKIIISAQVDSEVKLQSANTECDLSLMTTGQCTTIIVIRARGLDGESQYYNDIMEVHLTIFSQCYYLNGLSNAQRFAFWTWSETYQNQAALGYRLRDPQVSFGLPFVSPKSKTGESLEPICGPLVYSTNNAIRGYYNVTQPADADSYTTGINLDFWSHDESLVKHKSNFEDIWTAQVQAKFKHLPDVVNLISPQTVSFKVSDYCLGWTMSQANITIPNDNSVFNSSMYDPGMRIEKYAKSGETLLDFSKLDYTQADITKVNEGCDVLFYKVHPITYFVPNSRAPPDVPDYILEHLVQQKDGTFDQERSKRLHVDAPSETYVGSYALTIEVDSVYMQLEPHFSFTIEIVILPCFVESLDQKNQLIPDQELIIGSTIELPFESFEQVPLCNYTTECTATTFQKPHMGAAALAYIRDQDGQVDGTPPLVKIDLNRGKIVLSAIDGSLLSKSFQVYITCHVATNAEVQLEYYEYIKPFELTVVLADSLLNTNIGPQLRNFTDALTLGPASTQLVSLGTPFDVEGDEFYVDSYSVVDGQGIPLSLPWVLFSNKTSSKSIDFLISPPETAAGLEFTIDLELKDVRVVNQRTTRYSTHVKVLDRSTFVPVFNEAKKEREQVRPVIAEKRKIKVKISEPSKAGKVDVSFSSAFQVPSSAAEWTNQNMGASFFSIAYQPHQKTKHLYEDLSIKQSFSWRVSSVKTEQKPQGPQNRLLQSSDLVEVRKFTIQLEWSSARYVSQHAEKDEIEIKTLPDLYSFDPEIEHVLSDTSSPVFKAKIPQQVSEAELEVIEDVQIVTNGFLRIFMSTNFFLTIFIVSVLQLLWGIVNTLQLIMLTALFSVEFPVNSFEIVISIMKLTNLDIIDTESLLRGIFTFRADNPAFSTKFEQVGYDSSNFIINLGMLFLIICASGVFFLLRWVILKAMGGVSNQNCLKKRLKGVNGEIVVVRFLIEGCLEVCLVALITVRMMTRERFDYAQDTLEVVLAFTALACLAIAPFYILYASYMLIYKRGKLSESRREAIEELFSTFKLNSMYSLNSVALIFIRRVAMVGILVYLPNFTLTQIHAQLLTTLTFASYTASVLPYRSYIQGAQEIFNEMTVIFAGYHLLGFTDWIHDRDMRFGLGWSMIATILTNVLLNFTIVSVVAVKAALRNHKIRYQKQCYLRYQQDYMERQKQLKIYLEEKAAEQAIERQDDSAGGENQDQPEQLLQAPKVSLLLQSAENVGSRDLKEESKLLPHQGSLPEQQNEVQAESEDKQMVLGSLLTPYVNPPPLGVDYTNHDFTQVTKKRMRIPKKQVYIANRLQEDKSKRNIQLMSNSKSLAIGQESSIVGLNSQAKEDELLDFDDPYFGQEESRQRRQVYYPADSSLLERTGAPKAHKKQIANKQKLLRKVEQAQSSEIIDVPYPSRSLLGQDTQLQSAIDISENSVEEQQEPPVVQNYDVGLGINLQISLRPVQVPKQSFQQFIRQFDEVQHRNQEKKSEHLD